MRGTRANALLLAALATAALVLAVYSLRSASDPALVARAWPATALTTVLLILAPPRRVHVLTVMIAALFLLASLVAGHGLLFAGGFAVANAVEALLILRWLTGFDVEGPQLRSWMDYRRWLLGVVVASLAAGAITAITIGLGGGVDLWRPMLWIAVTHMAAQMVTLPLCMRYRRHRIKVSVVELLSHLALLTLGGLACLHADQSEPVAFLLLPLLMWAAARFNSHWANIELFGVAVALTALAALGRGPFVEVTGSSSILAIAASSQSFIAIGALTSVAFSVATAHLRHSLHKIRENELQLGQLLDSASGTAFIATDLNGLVTWFSPGAEGLLGYSGDEVAGKLTPARFHDSAELLTRAQHLGVRPGYQVVTHPVELGAEQDTRDWTYVRQDGTRLTVSLSVTAVRNEEGAPLSFLSVVRDVTDRRAAERALVSALDKERETNHRMLELDRAKSDFVSTVSHELRTPLTSIVGYIELLSEDLSENLSEEQSRLVERIDRNGGRLLPLVEDLLTLTHVEEGELSVDRTETDLRAAAKRATDQVAQAALTKGVVLRLELPPDPVLLLGDPTYLERLVLNLVTNAVKFTDADGSVRVALDVVEGQGVLRVSDTGMGIPFEEQGRLFERFFRSSIATDHAIQGTGLGLHIVRSIAEAHHGDIAFDSAPGSGTTFIFTVPLIASHSARGQARGQAIGQGQARSQPQGLDSHSVGRGRHSAPSDAQRERPLRLN